MATARKTAAPRATPKKKKKKTKAAEAAATPATKAGKPANGGRDEPAAAGEKAAKPKKPKLVRDSFTIPKNEFAVLDDLKLRAARLGRPAKKSEVLRAGIMALAAMGDAAFLASVTGVPAVKTGRPAKDAG